MTRTPADIFSTAPDAAHRIRVHRAAERAVAGACHSAESSAQRAADTAHGIATENLRIGRRRGGQHYSKTCSQRSTRENSLGLPCRRSSSSSRTTRDLL